MEETRDWQDISTLSRNETAVTLRCDDGKERVGWRYEGSMLELSIGGAFVMDASVYKGNIAIKATHWKPLDIPTPPNTTT
jgi:hypothetical protein